MKRVCSIQCVYEEQFVIPRLFNVEYDVKKHHVCTKAGAFLTKHNLLRIHSKNPQVSLRQELKQFMIRRRQLHCVFDLFKCDTWVNIIERNGYASEKNLILRDCYLTLQQLAELQDGLLIKKVRKLENVLLKHMLSGSTSTSQSRDSQSKDSLMQASMADPLNACNICKLTKHRCEVCNGKSGPSFYEFEITVGSSCPNCAMRAHNICLRDRHKCTYLHTGAK